MRTRERERFERAIERGRYLALGILADQIQPVVQSERRRLRATARKLLTACNELEDELTDLTLNTSRRKT